MEVIHLAVGSLAVNCCIGYDPISRLGFIVDPGDDAARILHTIEREKLTITHILLTHGHFDHIMALSELKTALNATVCIHANDAPMLGSTEYSLAVHMPSVVNRFVPVTADVLLQDGDVLTLADVSVAVLHTPGHTTGSVCYDTGSVIFSGDTLFCGSWGRCDFPGGSTADMLSSLYRLSCLEGDRQIYPGHNDVTTLNRERQTNAAMLHAKAIHI